MSAKSRILGLLATIGLSLSLFGVAAADASVPVSVQLIESPSLCNISLHSEYGSFGRWDYDSMEREYYFDGGEGSSVRIIGTVRAYNIRGCDVTISFSGLTGPGGTIGPEYFSAYSDYSNEPVNPASFSFTGVGAGDYHTYFDFGYTLESVPKLDGGVYSGQIDATISNTP